jgi:hypothetical protein
MGTKPVAKEPSAEQLVEQPIHHESRQDFTHPLKFQIPNTADLALWYIVPILEQYNEQTLQRQADPLCIEALNVAPTLFHACDTVPVVHCLVRHNFFVKLQLKLVCELDWGWGAARVVVRDDDRWIRFEDFLRKQSEPTMKSYKKAALEVQYCNWRSTGHPFRFMDLPTELQKRILLFAIGE